MIKFTGKETLQEYYFKMSLNELDNKLDESNVNIFIDHINGVNWLNDKKYPILFPKSMITKIYQLPKIKNNNYYFKGVIGKDGKWVLNYKNDGIIENSTYGRNPTKKYHLDMDYYSEMSRSKFSLSPIGSCPWSYRLFESIMCYSIPILPENTSDIFHTNFKCLKVDDEHIYDYDICESNYKQLIKHHTLNN
jgi:hypothetical protein